MNVVKKYHFYAAHRNELAGEKCGRVHGHTYRVVCHFEFEYMQDGITMLFSDIDKVVEPIVKQYDHYLLLFKEDPLCDIFNTNEEPYIELPFETSAENLAIWIFRQIKSKLPIIKIELSETETSTVVYAESK